MWRMYKSGSLFSSRIAKEINQPNGIDLFVSGDQLLKGAALNAVQIAGLLLK